MFHDFPYTDYHELNLDWLVGRNGQCGFRLEVQGNYLRLINAKNEVVSQVLVHYAETALKDVDGRDIQTYIFSSSVSGDNLVFVHGDNTVTTITVPFATKASTDVQGKDLLNYIYNISISGDKLRITKGDGDAVELTIPFATKALNDADGKEISTYAASLEVDGDNLILRDAKGRLLNSITVSYALEAGHADSADEALEADHATEADHAETADSADEATLATDATNAIETVTISGDNMLFTTYGGQVFTIQSPYAVKAQKDDNGNTIKTTYVANVTQDIQTGELSFLDATGHVITTLTPTSNMAARDSYNNLIADYIKTLTVEQGSDYITVTHGTGDTDTITIDYATRAWKDTNNNVIKNTYVTYLDVQQDVEDGRYKLFFYNGDTPRAAIGSVELIADAAVYDPNGKELTSYVAEVSVDENDNTKINIIDGGANSLNIISGSVTSTPSGSVSASATVSGTAVTLTAGTLPSKSADSYTAPSWAYNSGSKTLEYNNGSFTEGAFSAGTFPTIDTVTDPNISVTATFTGTQSTDNVDFSD